MTATATRHEQAAPATAFALSVLRNLRHFEDPAEDLGESLSLVLLTLAAMADRDLYSGDGYNGHTAEDIADLLDLSYPQTAALLGRIHDLHIGYLDRLPGGRYRIPQTAYDRANGEIGA